MATPRKTRKTPTRARRPARAGKNSSQAEKIQLSLKRRLLSPAFLTIGGTFLGVLIIIFLVTLWFVKVYADPEHVFWTTVKNNLTTQSITKDSLRSTGTSSNEEFVQMQFTPELLVHDVKMLTNGSGPSAAKLTLDTIGTATTDYQRYSHIERPGSKKTQKDYQKIYNMWIKNGGQEGTSGQIVANSIFGAALFGNFNAPTRDKLFNELKIAYKVDFANVNKHGDAKRRTYVYHVSIPLKQYARAAHDYAQALGLPIAAQINSNNYQSTDQLDVVFTVDVLSRQLKKVEYPRQSFTENYSGQGLVANISLPGQTVSGVTFQKAINSLSQ